MQNLVLSVWNCNIFIFVYYAPQPALSVCAGPEVGSEIGYANFSKTNKQQNANIIYKTNLVEIPEVNVTTLFCSV